ncbi:MAG: hypothetical protein NVSMB3_03640 [Acidobacteriaceae bacterium]
MVATSSWAQGKRPEITGIAFVRFLAADPAAAKAFYGERLGLQESDAGTRMQFAVGMRQRIEVDPLASVVSASSPAPKSRLEEVGFLTRDVAGMRVFLERHGLKVEDEGAGQIGTTDPEGNKVAFVQESKIAPARPTVLSTLGKPGAPTSRRIIHAGWEVHDRAAENAFYLKLLGFRPYWYGGMQEGRTDWVSLQVPEGTDWIEYMLGAKPDADARQLGVLNHVSLGVKEIDDATKQLIANGWTDPQTRKSQMGKDGKMQLNVFDPDQSRVEFMEFQPRQKPCCSEFTAKSPTGDTE